MLSKILHPDNAKSLLLFYGTYVWILASFISFEVLIGSILLFGLIVYYAFLPYYKTGECSLRILHWSILERRNMFTSEYPVRIRWVAYVTLVFPLIHMTVVSYMFYISASSFIETLN